MLIFFLKNRVDPESIELRSKILSLELLLSILETSGSAFRVNKKFVKEVIKKNLLKALVPNYFSNMPAVFELSLKIFSCLMAHFKDYLKAEIGVFFHKVLLQTLESPNSNNTLKQMVMEVILKICRTPQTLVDIFVNYDCDIDSKDIFERMVNDLSQITKTTNSTKLRELSLQTLLRVVKSLVEWTNMMLEQEQQQLKLHTVANKNEDAQSSPAAIKSKEIEEFEKAKNLKTILEEGKKLFSEKPKNGIRFFVEKGFIKETPESIAEFFHTTSLNMSAIGDYLSEPNEFNKQILYAYVEYMSFKGMDIDMAVRHFLKGFRLPGEGQKIDRCMEKFAEKYFNDNANGIFANADAAYMVAYAIIMLTTDLHRNSKHSTMTKDAWKKTLKGLNDGQDFTEAFLFGIHDRIAAEPINCQDDDVVHNMNNAKTPANSLLLQSQQSAILMQQSKELLKSTQSSKVIYYKSNSIEHVRPMFKRTWAPLLAAFSFILKNYKESHLTEMCIEAFKCSIHIACHFGLDDERNSFINSISPFTLLNSPPEIQQKNVEAIRLLMNAAVSEGNNLKNSWYQILQCISNLDRLRLMRIQHLNDNPNPRASLSVEDENQRHIFEQISIDERIFTNSVSLTSEAIIDFTKALSLVSKEDIARNSTYSLQKLVEVSAYNMGRIRMVWSTLWKLLSEHFVEVSCLDNKEIAMTAIDSLKQLAFKYLEKDELSNYNFQKEFLKPFEEILKGTKSNDMKMLVRTLSSLSLFHF